MIWPDSVAAALYTVVASDTDVDAAGIQVDLHEPLNTDPNRMPWAGIWLNDVTGEGRRANTTQPWNAVYDFSIYCNDGDMREGGQQARYNALQIATKVMTAVNCNRTLGISGLYLREWSVRPYRPDVEEEDAMFYEEINLQFEIPA